MLLFRCAQGYAGYEYTAAMSALTRSIRRGRRWLRDGCFIDFTAIILGLLLLDASLMPPEARAAPQLLGNIDLISAAVIGRG